MTILDGLLNSYGKLRKRKYSFSEAMLVGQEEQFSPQQLELFNNVTSFLDNTVKASLAATANTAAPAQSQNDPAVKSAEKGTPFLLPSGELLISSKGTIPAAEIPAFIKWLESLEGGSKEKGEGFENIGSVPPAPPITDGKVVGLTDKANTLAEKLGVETDPELMLASLERLQASLDGKEVQSNFGRVAKRLKVGNNLNFEDEALLELAEDFGDFLDIFHEFSMNTDDCINVEPGSKQEKLLDRFFLREGGKALMYGSASRTNFPKIKQGVDEAVKDETDRLKAKSGEARYGGVKIAMRQLPSSLGGGENPLFSILDKAKDIPKCGSKESAFKSGGGKGAVSRGFTTARSFVNEHIPMVASVMEHLKNNPNDVGVRDQLSPIVEGILSRVEKHLIGFQGMSALAFGDNSPLDILADEELAEMNDFLDAIGLQTDGSNVRNVARAFTAQLILDELSTKEFEQLRAGQGYKSHVVEYKGKKFASYQGIVPRGQMWFPTHTAERTTADYGIEFESGEAAIDYVRRMGSTASPRRLQQILETGIVGVSDKFYSAEKDLSHATLQLGMMNVNSMFTPEANEVFNVNLKVLAEKGVSDVQISNIKKERRRQANLHKQIEDSFTTLNFNPAEESESSYLMRANHMEGLVGQFNQIKQSAPAEKLEEIEGAISALEEYRKNPGSSSETGHLKAKVYNVMSLATETPQTQKARAAHDILMAGASTNEVLFKARVFGGETYEASQSQIVDDNVLKILDGSLVSRSSSTGFEVLDPLSGESKMRTSLRFKDGRVLYDANMRGNVLLEASESATAVVSESNRSRQALITKGLREALENVLEDILKKENFIF